MTNPGRFAEYMNQSMSEDGWKGPKPELDDIKWFDKIYEYIEWLRKAKKAEIEVDRAWKEFERLQPFLDEDTNNEGKDEQK